MWMMRHRAWLGLLLLLGCSSAGASDGPTRALSRFLEAMNRSGSDRSGLKEAYMLLDTPARTALQQRAVKAESLSGRRYEPWEMLVQGRFRLRFTPRKRGGMKASVDGDQARVTVLGPADSDRATISMRREEGSWRVSLEIPAMRSPPPTIAPLSDGPRVPQGP